VEHGADDAGGYSATRAAAEDQGLERSRAEVEHMAFVNTKIWYTGKSDLWAQLGKKSRPEKEGFFKKIR
jgi:hypothetical protein